MQVVVVAIVTLVAFIIYTLAPEGAFLPLASLVACAASFGFLVNSLLKKVFGEDETQSQFGGRNEAEQADKALNSAVHAAAAAEEAADEAAEAALAAEAACIDASKAALRAEEGEGGGGGGGGGDSSSSGGAGEEGGEEDGDGDEEGWGADDEPPPRRQPGQYRGKSRPRGLRRFRV